jgi:uncharacterized membrane protein
MQSLNDLRQKIQTLEAERSQLKTEIENLRKAAETRAAALEEDIEEMRDEVKTLRELLVQSDSTTVGRVVPQIDRVSKPVQPVQFSSSVSVAEVSSIAQPKAEISQEELLATQEPGSNDSQAVYETLMKTLTGDERKVVEVLLAHGGKYSQKYIRTEAELSWLQTNRVVSRLAERGIITLEKDGGLGNVVLTNQIK